ncbi:MAG: ABC transporter permease [Rhodothermales bacterium]
MIPFARRILADDKTRSSVTLFGVAVAVMLNISIYSIYEGARLESTGYVRQRNVDLWVARKDATNLKLSLSYYNAFWEDSVAAEPGVESVASLLRTVATSHIGDKLVNLFIFGVDPSQTLAKPSVVAGTADIKDGEIVVDRTFAAKYDLVPGDSLRVQDRMFAVKGLSEGTNNVIMQMAFVTHADAERILGFYGILSFTMVKLVPGASVEETAEGLARHLPKHTVFTQDDFVRDNLAIVEQSTLPILWVVTILSALAGGVILTLMLFGAVLERREEYATLKAVGAGESFLVRLILRQSLILVVGGFLLGLALFFAIKPLLFILAPTLSMSFSTSGSAVMFGGALVIGVCGAWLPVRKLRSIYPTEAFRT